MLANLNILEEEKLDFFVFDKDSSSNLNPSLKLNPGFLISLLLSLKISILLFEF